MELYQKTAFGIDFGLWEVPEIDDDVDDDDYDDDDDHDDHDDHDHDDAYDYDYDEDVKGSTSVKVGHQFYILKKRLIHNYRGKNERKQICKFELTYHISVLSSILTSHNYKDKLFNNLVERESY